MPSGTNARRQGTAGAGEAGKGFWLAVAAVAVVGLIALFLAGRGGGDEGGDAEQLSVVSTSDIAADPAAGHPVGPEDAPAVIMEFADFRCPHCRQFNSVTGKLLRQNYARPGGPLRWISYDFPLWPESLMPAMAAGCAAEQGQYWKMHDYLFARVESWINDKNPRDKFVEYARTLGLDGKEFETCLDERRPLPRLLASRKYGEQLGVRGTPTLFLNGKPVEQTPEMYSYEGLERRILALAAGDEGQEEAGGTGSSER